MAINYNSWSAGVNASIPEQIRAWEVINAAELGTVEAYKTMLETKGFEIAKTSSALNTQIQNYRSIIPAVDPELNPVAGALNSNTALAPYTPGNVVSVAKPATASIDAAGKVSFSTTLKQGINFVSSTVVPAVVGVSTGIALGKILDTVIYQAAPDFWDQTWPEINPETWNDIVINDDTKFSGKAMQVLFGLDPNTGKTQMYAEQAAVASAAFLMYSQGWLKNYQETDPDPEIYEYPLKALTHSLVYSTKGGTEVNRFGPELTAITPDTFFVLTAVNNDPYTHAGYVWSIVSSSASAQWYENNEIHSMAGSGQHTFIRDGKQIYWKSGSVGTSPSQAPIIGDFSLVGTEESGVPAVGLWSVIYGEKHGFNVPGVSDQPDAQQLQVPYDVENESQMLDVLQVQYPDLWNNSVVQDVVQETAI